MTLELEADLHACGFSARSAVQAALRCGLTCEGWDCFADRDATQLSRWHRLDDLRISSLQELLRRRPAMVLPCGGLENRPALWKRLGERHRLLGPDPYQLQRLRSPRWLLKLCSNAAAGLDFPESFFSAHEWDQTVRQMQAAVADGLWLIKRRRSAGGVGIARLMPRSVQCGPREAAAMRWRNDEYLQRFIAGQEFGIVLQCGPKPRILAAAKPWPRELSPVHCAVYRGSIAPVVVPRQVVGAVEHFAAFVADAVRYRGVLQIDVIHSENTNRVFLLEVNPRWSGSMELAELLCPGSILSAMTAIPLALQEYRAAVSKGGDPLLVKYILYAEQEIEITWGLSDAMFADAWAKGADQPSAADDCCGLADIPQAGTQVAAGQPICTVLATGPAASIAARVTNYAARWVATFAESQNRPRGRGI